MKLRLPRFIKTMLLACYIGTVTTTTIASDTTLADSKQANLGNVMYVGDSISHDYLNGWMERC